MAEEYLKINGALYYADQLRDKHFVLSISDGDEALADFLADWFDEKDYVIGHTSGSTGTPKQICLSKNAMRESARRTNAFFQMGEGTSILLCLSANYIAGKMMIVRSLVGKIDLYLEKPSSTPSLNGYFDLVSMVPMQIYSLRKSKDGESRLNRVRNLLVGGGPLPLEEAQWLKTLPLHTFVSYGMTETVSHVALASLSETDSEGSIVYHALPSVSFGQDDRDCLIIHAEYLTSEPIVTNDVVSLISATSFIWKGRWDNVINTGGVKVHPEMMEKKLSPYISQEFYFKAEPDAKFGQKVVLKIEGNPFPLGDLWQTISSILTPYEMPKDIQFVERFVRTESGKVKRI